MPLQVALGTLNGPRPERVSLDVAADDEKMLVLLDPKTLEESKRGRS
jgi:hypothetical protein